VTLLDTFKAMTTVLCGEWLRDGPHERYIARLWIRSTAYLRNEIDGRGALGTRGNASGYPPDTPGATREVITQQQLVDTAALVEGAVFWTFAASRKILIPDYWKFPKDAVLQSTGTDSACVLLHDADVVPIADLYPA